MHDHNTAEISTTLDRPVRPGRGRWQRRGRGQQGTTLIELLVAAAVMGIVVLGIASGYLTTTKIAARNDDVAASEAGVSAAVESVGDLAYRPCATLTQIRADVAGVTAPTGFTISVASVRYLAAAGTGFVAGPCTTDRGAQLIALDVTRQRPGAKPVRGEVVLRNPAARP